METNFKFMHKEYGGGIEEGVADFDRQYEARESFELLGGKVETIDVKPERQTEEVPLVFACGWSETAAVVKDILRTAVDQGRRAITFFPARLKLEQEQTNYPAEELLKALALLKTIEEKQLGKVDIVAHSEGAINATIAASLEPEKIRNMVLVGPGGMIGPDKFPKLFARFNRSLIQNSLQAFMEQEVFRRRMRGTLEAVKYTAIHPVTAMKEAGAISSSDIHNMLKDLHSSGIGISIIHGGSDLVFPMQKIQEYTKREEVDGFYSVKGGHHEIFVHPEKYMKLACTALDALKQMQERKFAAH